jgi:hypothetical protein
MSATVLAFPNEYKVLLDRIRERIVRAAQRSGVALPLNQVSCSSSESLGGSTCTFVVHGTCAVLPLSMRTKKAASVFLDQLRFYLAYVGKRAVQFSLCSYEVMMQYLACCQGLLCIGSRAGKSFWTVASWKGMVLDHAREHFVLGVCYLWSWMLLPAVLLFTQHLDLAGSGLSCLAAGFIAKEPQ